MTTPKDLRAYIYINLNKLPMVTAEELAWEPDDDQREDNYIKLHNRTVLDLNLPRELCFQKGDIPIDIGIKDAVNDTCWYTDGVFIGKEAENDEEGCGTVQHFIEYLPDRIISDLDENMMLKLPCACDCGLFTIELIAQQNDATIESPFGTFQEALKFMVS